MCGSRLWIARPSDQTEPRMTNASTRGAVLRRAFASYAAGNDSEARALAVGVLHDDGADVDALRLVGHIALRQGHDTAAAAWLRRAVALVPGYAETLNALGASCLTSAPQAADTLCSRALAADPGSADALYNRAMLAASRGDDTLSRRLFEDAIVRRPDHVSAWNGLGAALRRSANFERAGRAWRVAVALDPGRAEALANVAALAWEMRAPGMADAAAGRALAIDAQLVSGQTARALACRDLDRHREGMAHSRRAVSLAPSDGLVLCNHGICLMSQGDPRAAATVQSRAIAIQPQHAEARWNRGVALLQVGDAERGWRDYAWRWRMPGFTSPARDFRQPRWNGSPVNGRTILLHAEQGLGDTLQFLRYVPLVKDYGAVVALEVQPELRRLLAEWQVVDRLIVRGDSIPDFDSHAALMDLPEILGETSVTGPGCVPYLPLPPPMDEFVFGTREMRIGLVWAGGTAHRNDRRRSLPSNIAANLARHLAGLPGVRLVTLQLGGARLDDRTRALALDLSERLTDMAATAAALQGIDLLVTVDTAIAHLAGAIARPAFVMLAQDADFRWRLAREDSPWYPTLRLFRQSVAGSWEDVVDRITDAATTWRLSARGAGS